MEVLQIWIDQYDLTHRKIIFKIQEQKYKYSFNNVESTFDLSKSKEMTLPLATGMKLLISY